MAIIKYDPTENLGEEYLNRLMQESNRNFQIFMALLSSYWQSRIDGPMYARMLRSMSIELARIRLTLEDVRGDGSYRKTRAEYLYQTLTSILFREDRGFPDLQKSDVEFREFLVEIVRIYFAGSVPSSLERALELLVGKRIRIRENYKEAQRPGSGYDISDQFGFGFDIIMDDPGEIDTLQLDRNLAILFALISPAHTLYKLKYVMEEECSGPNGPPSDNLDSYKFQDSMRMMMESYSYEDFRKFVDGVYRIDFLGFKKSHSVTGEVVDPKPVVLSTSPTTVSPLGETVQVNGNYFASDARIFIEGVAYETTYIDSQTLSAEFPAHAVGNSYLWVKQESGTSNNLNFNFI